MKSLNKINKMLFYNISSSYNETYGIFIAIFEMKDKETVIFY